MRIKCKSGMEGEQSRLQSRYNNFAHFETYSDTYGLHTRLGYKTPKMAWKKNPMVQSSVIPSDFRKVQVKG